MVGQKTLSITANKRNCMTMLHLDNKFMGVGSIRTFATVIGNNTKNEHEKNLTILLLIMVSICYRHKQIKIIDI